MNKRLAFIMAGGVGERFWPLSRASRPKQLLNLTSRTQNLLEEAVSRAEALFGSDGVYVITGRNLLKPIVESRIVPDSQVWAEPAKRNTLGALVWVAARLKARGDGDATLAILTADHKIEDPDAFRATVAIAVEAAEETGGLVTCGITPTRPETGYGYIEPDSSQKIRHNVYRAKGFREKPSASEAAGYVEAGFLWNSGMFFWRVEAFSNQLQAANPDVHRLYEDISGKLASGAETDAEKVFAELPDISIDYALMERAHDVYVVNAGFGWDDVGAWDALPRTLGTSADGSTELGRVVSIDTSNSVLYNASDKAVLATIGIENLIVVVTDDAVLVCTKNQAQRVKEIVELLRADPGSPL